MWDTAAWSPSRPLHSASSAILSASGTVDGSTSNALDHVTSPWDGSGASSTRPPPARLGDPRHLHGPAHQVGRLLRPHVDRGGEPDRAVDHDAHAHAEVGVVGRRLGLGVVEADRLAPDALDPELGRLAAGGRVERGVGQAGEVVGGERHQSTGVGWRSGRPAAV